MHAKKSLILPACSSATATPAWLQHTPLVGRGCSTTLVYLFCSALVQTLSLEQSPSSYEAVRWTTSLLLSCADASPTAETQQCLSIVATNSHTQVSQTTQA